MRSIAQQVYGNPSLWFVIADANGLTGDEQLTAGTVLKIPNTVELGRLTSETHAVYSESGIVGSRLPNLKAPPPDESAKCAAIGAIIGVILLAIVGVILSIVTIGIAAPAAAAAVGAAAGAAAGIIAGVLVGAAIGAVIAFSISALSQLVLVGAGLQKEFDWTQVLADTAVGFISGGVAGLGELISAGILVGRVAKIAVTVASVALEATGETLRQVIVNPDHRPDNPLSIVLAGVGAGFGAAATIATRAAKLRSASKVAGLVERAGITDKSLIIAGKARNTIRKLQDGTKIVKIVERDGTVIFKQVTRLSAQGKGVAKVDKVLDIFHGLPTTKLFGKSVNIGKTFTKSVDLAPTNTINAILADVKVVKALSKGERAAAVLSDAFLGASGAKFVSKVGDAVAPIANKAGTAIAGAARSASSAIGGAAGKVGTVIGSGARIVASGLKTAAHDGGQGGGPARPQHRQRSGQARRRARQAVPGGGTRAGAHRARRQRSRQVPCGARPRDRRAAAGSGRRQDRQSGGTGCRQGGERRELFRQGCRLRDRQARQQGAGRLPACGRGGFQGRQRRGAEGVERGQGDQQQAGAGEARTRQRRHHPQGSRAQIRRLALPRKIKDIIIDKLDPISLTATIISAGVGSGRTIFRNEGDPDKRRALYFQSDTRRNREESERTGVAVVTLGSSRPAYGSQGPANGIGASLKAVLAGERPYRAAYRVPTWESNAAQTTTRVYSGFTIDRAINLRAINSLNLLRLGRVAALDQATRDAYASQVVGRFNNSQDDVPIAMLGSFVPNPSPLFGA